jgi:hypothetical protein
MEFVLRLTTGTGGASGHARVEDAGKMSCSRDYTLGELWL